MMNMQTDDTIWSGPLCPVTEKLVRIIVLINIQQLNYWSTLISVLCAFAERVCVWAVTGCTGCISYTMLSSLPRHDWILSRHILLVCAYVGFAVLIPADTLSDLCYFSSITPHQGKENYPVKEQTLPCSLLQVQAFRKWKLTSLLRCSTHRRPNLRPK